MKITGFLNQVLPLVSKPGRYVGNEINIVRKDFKGINLRVALFFPDVYEIGMSNLGMRILYHVINLREEFYAERVFLPWKDMIEYMESKNVPLFSLETFTPLCEFDVIGVSLHAEMCYTNVLKGLQLGQIPVFAEERKEEDPIVVGGGSATANPEPIGPFFDLILIGDGEEAFPQMLDIIYSERKRKTKRIRILERIQMEVEGVYVPRFYTAKKDNRGILNIVKPTSSAYPEQINKTIMKDLDQAPYPTRWIVPNVEIVHDRLSIELMRGCPRRCTFCSARCFYYPLRRRSVDNLIQLTKGLLEDTGYEQVGLLSLSSTDYKGIERVVDDLIAYGKERTISISLPSIRIDSFSLGLISRIQDVKKTGLTFAPETCSQRLLDVINKGYRKDDIFSVAKEAFSVGYRRIKLYIMIGLPEETEEDLDAIVHTAYRLSKLRKELGYGPACITLSIGPLIPKPHTPLERMDMISLEEINQKYAYLKSRLRSKFIKFDFHLPERSLLEGVFSRGDRQLASVINMALQKGALFDEWDSEFSFDLWEQAFKEAGIDYTKYIWGWAGAESFPWSHIRL